MRPACVLPAMQLAVFGATGRTGRPLVEQATERGHEVVAFARRAESVPDRDGVETVVGDAYTGEGVPEAVDGADAVISVLGQTGDGPDDLLTVAGDNVLDAMEEHGVDRFVTLVGAGVRREGDDVSLGGRVMGALLKLVARSVLEDARTHVERVVATDLDWTVVRTPRLTEGDPTGSYRAGTDLSLGARDSIPRADLARFVLDAVENGQYVRECPLVTG